MLDIPEICQEYNRESANILAAMLRCYTFIATYAAAICFWKSKASVICDVPLMLCRLRHYNVASSLQQRYDNSYDNAFNSAFNDTFNNTHNKDVDSFK